MRARKDRPLRGFVLAAKNPLKKCSIDEWTCFIAKNTASLLRDIGMQQC